MPEVHYADQDLRQGSRQTFTVPVRTFREARLLLSTLARYDAFQFAHRVKPDYCNVGGLQMFDPSDDEDSPHGSWVDYYTDDGDEIKNLSDEQIDELDAQNEAPTLEPGR